MAGERDDQFREVLLEASQHVGYGADAEDLRRRLGRRSRRRRVGAALTGLTAGLSAIGLLIYFVGPIGSHVAQRPPGAQRTAVLSANVPEGDLLLQSGTDSELASARGETPLGSDTFAVAFSPDGSKVLALTELLTGGSGGRQLVTIDVSSGSGSPRSVVVQAGPGQVLDLPIEWSPNGNEVAYTVAQESGPDQTTLCAVDLLTKNSRCFPQIGHIAFADWAPDSVHLALGLVPPGQPIEVLDVSTGQVSILATPQDPAVVSAVREAGLGTPVALQFVEPRWSPSGAYVATMALVFLNTGNTDTGAVPLVFRSDGTLVTQGHPSPDLRELAWSTTDDTLAYAVGVLGTFVGTPPPWSAYLLDPRTGDDRLLLSTEGVPNNPGISDPFIVKLVWSPDGRWLALDGRDEIRFVDVVGGGTEQAPITGDLMAWGR